jgi:hypothetical protein
MLQYLSSSEAALFGAATMQLRSPRFMIATTDDDDDGHYVANNGLPTPLTAIPAKKVCSVALLEARLQRAHL